MSTNHQCKGFPEMQVKLHCDILMEFVILLFIVLSELCKYSVCIKCMWFSQKSFSGIKFGELNCSLHFVLNRKRFSRGHLSI